MLDLHEAGSDIGVLDIYETLKADGVSVSYITNLTLPENAPCFVRLDNDIERIISASRLRSLKTFADRLDTKVENGETEEEILAFASEWIDGARTKLPRLSQVRALSEMVDDQAERYRLWHKGISNALPTGFDILDKYLLGGGLVASGLYIFAARPSMGKTSLALDIAANIAQQNKTVYMVSREMPAESLLDRLHAANAGVARWKLRPGIYQQEYHRLIETLPHVCELPIIFDNASLSVADLRSNLRDQERKQRRANLIIVDYVQQFMGKGRSRTEEVGSITRDLKGLAMELQIPIIGLSQLSRESDKQKREPELADLRDSGEIEQDADAVFFLFGERPEEGAKIYSRWLKCSKQRDGQLFRSEMVFNGELVTFRSLEQLIAIQGGIQ
jgi:replicative DNA helicase